MKYTKTKYFGIYGYKTAKGEQRYRVRHTYNNGLSEHSKSGFTTLAEARAYQADVVTKFENGQENSVIKSQVTLNQYWERYREHKISAGKWNLATQKNNAHKIYPFLKKFGSVNLSDISRTDVQKYIRYLYDQNNYSQESMRSYFKLFMAVIDDAVEEDILPKNIFRKVSYKRLDEWRPKDKTISLDQFKEFMGLAKEHMRPDVYRCLYILSFGLRRSEVYAIRERSITFLETGLAKIDIDMAKTVHEPNGTKPKSKASRRFIIVDAVGAELLKEQLEYSRFIKKVHNKILHPDDFIFISPRTGMPYPDKTLSNHIDRISQMMKTPVKLSPHMFRHMFSTYASASGVDVLQLQKFLGHGSTQMTGHYTKESEIGAINIVNMTSAYRNF